MDKLVENVARRFKEACGCASQQQHADLEMVIRDPGGDEKVQIGPAGPGEQVAVAPPGWEDTVKKMKKHKDKIDNPWALAWYMKNKGAEPHKEGSSLKAVLAAQEEMQQEQKGQQQQQAQLQQEAVAPPGWEDTVKKMKKHKEIDNPWALAWYMKNKGAEPHHASDKYVLAAHEAFKRHQAKAAKNAGK